MLRGQLDPAVIKLIPLRSASLKMRMSPVPLSLCQTLDPEFTRASGKLSGSRCVLASFHSQFTPEKSTVFLAVGLSTVGSSTVARRLWARRLWARRPVLALFAVGDVYVSLCKKSAYAPFSARRRS